MSNEYSTLFKCRGFSLIELLVVVFIIALGFSFVGVSVNDNSALRLKIEAKKFANSTALIAEQAVLNNQQWGVDLFREVINGEDVFGYRWLVRNDLGQWQLAPTINDDEEILFSDYLSLRLELEGSGEEEQITQKRSIIDQEASSIQTPSVVEQTAENVSEQPTDEDERITPAIWLLSSGEMSPFKLTLFNRNDTESNIVIVGDELGRIKLETEADEP